MKQAGELEGRDGGRLAAGKGTSVRADGRFHQPVDRNASYQRQRRPFSTSLITANYTTLCDVILDIGSRGC